MSNLRFCLMWVTERPYCQRSRDSSAFRMLGEEWFLRITMLEAVYNISVFPCYVELRQRNCRKKLITPFNINATCIALAGDKLMKSASYNLLVPVRGNIVRLFNFDYNPSQNNGETSDTWRVICSLSSNKEDLKLQINNESIILSTEEDKTSPIASADKDIQTFPESPQSSEILFLDMARMLKQEVYPDFKLNCGGRTFPVHKSILAVRSEVFATMLRNSEQNEVGSFDIKDLKVSVLDVMLKFIYSGKLEDIYVDNAADLYEAANKYAMQHLRAACTSWMILNLDEENCLGYLLAADTHSDPDLKMAASSFIVEHPAILGSTAWGEFSKEHPKLAIDVCNSYFSPACKKIRHSD